MSNKQKRTDDTRSVRNTLKPRYNYDILKKGGKHIKKTNKQTRKDGKKEIDDELGESEKES